MLHLSHTLARVILSLSLVVILLFVSPSCRRDDGVLHEPGRAVLAFSADTISFDTVFVTMGTTTRQMRVYNRNSDAVVLRSVRLQGGAASRFRLNVDGDTSRVARNVRIEPHDSIFIFVQATINPNDQTAPFLVEDAIIFEPDDCSPQQVVLTAWGRNAVYHIPTDTLHRADGTPLRDRYGNPYAYSVIDCDTWDHTLPHVVVGYAVVDSGNTLSLTAGDELYFATDAVLWVYNGATLTAMGSEEQPVLFTSVRHDGWYDDLAGQWGHIWLGGISGGSSKGCVMQHVKIENAYYGIIADSNDYAMPTLDLSYAEIGHMKVAALQLDQAWVTATRLLLYDCGGATIYVPMGGRYSFSYVTSANYWCLQHRETPSLILANWYQSAEGAVVCPLEEASFSNCIFYGNRSNGEMLLDAAEQGAFNVSMQHCLVRGGEWDEDPQFEDKDNHNYHVKEGSPAEGIGYYASSE